MQNQIDTLRQLNYELLKTWGCSGSGQGFPSDNVTHYTISMPIKDCLFRNWQSFYRWITPR